MKRMTNKTKIYETVYNVLRMAIYFAVAGISIAYLIFLFLGQEKNILLNVEFTLLFAVFLLWQVDILARKKLYKSNKMDEKRDKKYTIAVCVALVAGIICAVSHAIMSYCNLSGRVTLAVAVITISAGCITTVALAAEYALKRKTEVEEQTDSANSIDESGAEGNTEENDRS